LALARLGDAAAGLFRGGLLALGWGARFRILDLRILLTDGCTAASLLETGALTQFV
jgi:hypothetical protein